MVKPNNPGGEDSDVESPDFSQPGGLSGSDETDILGESDKPGPSDTSNDSVNVESGDSKGTGNKLPNTATNMYSYLLARCIMLLAGLSLLRRKKA